MESRHRLVAFMEHTLLSEIQSYCTGIGPMYGKEGAVDSGVLNKPSFGVLSLGGR